MILFVCRLAPILLENCSVKMHPLCLYYRFSVKDKTRCRNPCIYHLILFHDSPAFYCIRSIYSKQGQSLKSALHLSSKT